MDEDEIKAKRIAQYAIGQDLSDLSIEEVRGINVLPEFFWCSDRIS